MSGGSTGEETGSIRPVIRRADTPLRRMRGLLGKSGLPAGEGLLIVPCNAIHTLGMRFTIDAHFYSRQGVRVRTVRNIRPGRLWIFGGLGAHSVLECAAGDAAFDGLERLPETQGRKDPLPAHGV